MSKNDIKQHQLYLVRPSVWKKLKDDNLIDDVYKKRAGEISFYSALTYPFQLLQFILFDKKVRKLSFEDSPPLFILGHWRSGTTHLHYMLSKDSAFGFLSNYQAYLFNTAFLSKKLAKKFVSLFFPEKRTQDNIALSTDDPAEEEQPLTTFSAYSGLHGFFFPKNKTYFEKYNLFKNISDEEKKGWQRDYLYLLKSIALFNDKRTLLLKNPHNTGRVKELLELFPDAKFIFIHRDPYVVYKSTIHLYNKLVKTQFLQNISSEELEDLVIENFKNTLKKYSEEKHLIPEGNLVEISFRELEDDPMGVSAKIYSALNLPGFEAAKLQIESYLQTVNDYKKNNFETLPNNLKERIRKEWDFFFEEYSYST